MMYIRPMETEDIEFALSLTRIEDWSDIKGDFEALINYRPEAVFISEDDNGPTGMISAVSYGKFGFIGCLIVSPQHRGKGIGEDLLTHAISHLHNLGTSNMMLDAVPDAMSQYTRHGFRPSCKSLRLSGKIIGSDSRHVRPVTSNDLSAIFELDRRAFGANRSHFLQARWEEFPELCLCLEREKRIVSFAIGSRREGHVRIAPWIVTHPGEFNSDLLRNIVLASDEGTLALGVLESNVHSLDLLKKLGFSEYSYSVRMVLGENQRNLVESQYAIGSPAKG